MPWTPQPTVTINGTNRQSITLENVEISYGRKSVWEQARASYAVMTVLNTSNTDYGFDMNQSVSVKIKNSSGTDVTIFTGKITSVDNALSSVGSVATVATQTITAVGPFGNMSRKLIGDTSWAKEFDTDRMTRIFNDAGATIDVVDTPPIYEFKLRDANTQDAYTLAADYAQQANGYIYETATGKVGFANETHRTALVGVVGYTVIPNNYILWNSVSSQKTLADIMNSVIVSWRSGTETANDLTSQGTYGKVAGSVNTDLHNQSDAVIQANRYIQLRAYPRTSLSTFTMALDSDYLSNADRDLFIGVYMGLPLQITSLPIAIKNTIYKGFVEGYTFSINRYQTILSLDTTDYSYSFTPTRWQDVSSSLIWSGVGSTVQWATYDD